MDKTYWRIEELKNLLKMQQESELNCNVTRSEEADLKSKIGLMEEAFQEGVKSFLAKVQQVLDEVLNYYRVEEMFDKGYVGLIIIELEQLKSKIKELEKT